MGTRVARLSCFSCRMLPTAGLFRWSFRWLPFIHLVLAICAAEALQARPSQRLPLHRAWTPSLLMSFRQVDVAHDGPYAWPLTWIFLGLASAWISLRFSSSL